MMSTNVVTKKAMMSESEDVAPRVQSKRILLVLSDNPVGLLLQQSLIVQFLLLLSSLFSQCQ
jgi:hypothetical protein